MIHNRLETKLFGFDICNGGKIQKLKKNACDLMHQNFQNQGKIIMRVREKKKIIEILETTTKQDAFFF